MNKSTLLKLRSDLGKSLSKIMINDLGFEPDEVEDYCRIDIIPSENRIEVRAEVDYEELEMITEGLNKVIEKYDEDAYFEPVVPGIAEAYIENSNRMQSIQSSSLGQEHHDYIIRGGKKYSVYYNEIDNSPDADPYQMWEDFKAQVSMISPYDDADYVWANIKNGNIFIMKGNKAIDSSTYSNAEDMDIENDEWCQAVIDQAIDNISEINYNIEPKIIHY